MSNPHKDLKESLSSGRKPDITHVRVAFMNYTARQCEYGDKLTGGKYIRGNFRRPTGSGPHTEPTAEDFRRFQAYLRAAKSHIAETLDAMEMHLAYDPDLVDVEGMKRAAYAVDTDTKPNCPVGPSLMPHIAGSCASLNMAITQAADCGLLPRDPGQPWRANKVEAKVENATTEQLKLKLGDRVRVLETATGSAEAYQGLNGTIVGSSPGHVLPYEVAFFCARPNKSFRADELELDIVVEKTEHAAAVTTPVTRPVELHGKFKVGDKVRASVSDCFDNMEGIVESLGYGEWDYGVRITNHVGLSGFNELELVDAAQTTRERELRVGMQVRILNKQSSFYDAVGRIVKISPSVVESRIGTYLVHVADRGGGWYFRHELEIVEDAIAPVSGAV